jgi:hypothetical protein
VFPNTPDDDLLAVDMGNAFIDGSKVYTCGYRYIGGSPVYRDMRLEVWSSTDNGITWSKEVNVTEFASSTFPEGNEASLAKLPNGNFVVFFRWANTSSAVAVGPSLSSLTITDTNPTLGPSARNGLLRAGGGLLALYQMDDAARTRGWGAASYTEDGIHWTTPLVLTEEVAASGAGNVLQGGVLMANGDVYVPRVRPGGNGVDYLIVSGIPTPVTAPAESSP